MLLGGLISSQNGVKSRINEVVERLSNLEVVLLGAIVRSQVVFRLCVLVREVTTVLVFVNLEHLEAHLHLSRFAVLLRFLFAFRIFAASNLSGEFELEFRVVDCHVDVLFFERFDQSGEHVDRLARGKEGSIFFVVGAVLLNFELLPGLVFVDVCIVISLRI